MKIGSLKCYSLLAASALLTISCLYAEDDSAKKKPSKEELFSQSSVSKISEAYGHLIYKGLETPVVKLDVDAVIRGMQAAQAGKSSPMSEQEYEESVNLLQEYTMQEMAERNLKEADEFLAKNAKASGVLEIEPGKLQYIVLQKGDEASQTVSEESMPYILYTGSYLNGSIFGSTQDNNEAVPIVLQQTIPGFRRAMIGMKVGEKRKIFIHPSLGYGPAGQMTPNALLIFEVEVTKIEQAPPHEDQDEDDDLFATAIGDEDDDDDDSRDDDDGENPTNL